MKNSKEKKAFQRRMHKYRKFFIPQKEYGTYYTKEEELKIWAWFNKYQAKCYTPEELLNIIRNYIKDGDPN
jgi:hypothetical protein